MEEEFDMVEVKKVLEDAGMYDSELSKQLMIDYYKAIKDSKDMATVEDESRRINESQKEIVVDMDDDTTEQDNIEDVSTEINSPQSKEKPFIPKSWNSEKKLLNNDILEHNNNENLKEDNIAKELIGDLPKDATKVSFGFNEMVKDSEETLSIISHKLKFIPIQNSQVFLRGGTDLRTRMLYAYHTKVNKMKNQLARMSFYPAPLPKVTSVLNTFPSFSDDADFQETYVCRSGRQTKRKVYNYDDEDSLDGISNKKTKNSDEQEWLCKTPQNKSAVRKKLENNNHADIEKTETEATDTSSDSTKRNDNNSTTKQPQKTESRTPLSRKLSNLEIMKRSSIFGDTPKRRCETMFDKLKEEELKNQNKEKTTNLFYETLEQLDNENDETASETVSNEEVINIDDDLPVRKRVIPTIPGRKPINNRKRNKLDGLAPLNISINTPTQKRNITTSQSSSSNSSQDVEECVKTNALKKRLGQRKILVDSEEEPLPSTSQLLKVATSCDVLCPICNCLFSESKIQEHAATCGDDPIQTRSNSKISRITCEVCDMVVHFETNYDNHVKECMAKKKAKNL